MSTQKFTPGPWRISATGLSRYIDAPIRPGVLQEVAWCGATEEPGQMDANARLIAAAPSLLEALEELVRPYGVADVGMANAPDPLQMEFIAAVRKAKDSIAKALGEQS